MTKNKKNMVAFLGIGVVILFILGNALLDYNASHTLSGWLVGLLKINGKSGAENGDFILRKIAHLTEYAALGFFAQTLKRYLQKQGNFATHCFPFFCVLGVSLLDEFFQIFSSRTAAVKDVCLDCFGGTVGILFAILLWAFINKIKKNKSYRRNVQ